MASDDAPSLPPMGSFRRAFLGYRRAEVDAAIAGRDVRIGELEAHAASLSESVVGRESEIQSLKASLAEANARHDRSLAALESVTMRLDEIHAQARGQATRIRMKALREAVEINRRVKEIADRIDDEIEIGPAATNGADPIAENGNARPAPELFEGIVEVEIGPLGDFSQLVGFEDAAGRIGATSEISVRKFSEGRATLAMRLDEPVELLRELEERAPMEFRVRRTGGDRVVLDLDDDAAEAA
jgi:hypothetical protein